MISACGPVISALWGPRIEAPESLSRRTLQLLQALRSIHPVFRQWFVGQNGRGVEMPIVERSIFAGILAEKWEDGYFLALKTHQAGRGSENINLDMRGSSIFINCVALYTDDGEIYEESFRYYNVWRSAILAIAAAFDVERAFAYSNDMLDLQQSPRSGPSFPLSWISYVAPRDARLIVPPNSAIVEPQADGGLLLAATKDVFDVGNANHLAVARDIEAAGAALHGRRWEATS